MALENRLRLILAWLISRWWSFALQIFTGLEEESLAQLQESTRYQARLRDELDNDLLPEARLVLAQHDRHRRELNDVIADAVHKLNEIDRKMEFVRQTGRRT